jgi:hypothetical protein
MYKDLMKEEEFYSKEFYFSYSSISTLLYHPICFYNNYVLNQREVKSSDSLLEGKIIHSLILEKDKFENNYVVTCGEIPSSNTKIIIDTIYKRIKNDEKISSSLEDYKDLILEELINLNLHQKLVDDKLQTGDEKRVNKIIDDISKQYFEYLLNSGNKTVISNEMYNKCQAAADVFIQNENVCKLMGINDFNVEVFNEKEIKAELNDKSFGFRGFIDNFVIDKTNKIIRINDIKTTSKELINFTESIEYYKYWIQATIYNSLVLSYLESLDEDFSEYQLEFYFIVIDKYNMIYPFRVSNETLESWVIRFEEVIKKIDYYYTSRRYDLYYELNNNFIL